MLKPKSVLFNQQKNAVFIAAGVVCLMILFYVSRITSSKSSPMETDSERGGGGQQQPKPAKEYPIKVHATDVFVPAGAYSGPLKKPLEMVGASVSCPERGVSFVAY